MIRRFLAIAASVFMFGCTLGPIVPTEEEICTYFHPERDFTVTCEDPDPERRHYMCREARDCYLQYYIWNAEIRQFDIVMLPCPVDELVE